MLERKGKKESSVILGKGQGFLYFIWLIVFRAFFLFVQFHCALSVYSADVQFSVPSSPTVCLLSSSSYKIFLKFCVFCRTSGGASDCKCPTVISTREWPMDILL
jgi:hypothetical protein